MNVVVVKGCLSRDPEERDLPSGDRVVALEVTVREDGNPAESVPVACHNPARSVTRLGQGDEVVVLGRVRRRFFRAGGVTQSRTEVVATAVVAATSGKRVQTLLNDAAAALSRSSSAEP